MALANFFDKINLGAAQILKNHDRSAFEAKLNSICIGIHFDQSVSKSFEGKVALDLLTRLLSRLYPNLKFLGHSDEHLVKELETIAKAINPEINLSFEQRETHAIVIGLGVKSGEDIPTIYIGSDKWRGYFSMSKPQNIVNSNNPFGAASAVCIACANLFRLIFNMELGSPKLDQDVCFSVFTQTINPELIDPALPDEPVIHFTLVGAGAIGNAALWSLLQLQKAIGEVSVIDKETVALSNLQRYALMFQDHEKVPKVQVVHNLFDNYSKIKIKTYQLPWEEVAGKLSSDELKLVAVALDTIIQRVQLQAILPKIIINAWTSPECIGVSRHMNFLSDPCLACLYLPREQVKSESQKIADALGIGTNEPFVRQYLALDQPVDHNFASFVSQQGGIAFDSLTPFVGQDIRILYSDGICGGRVLSNDVQTATPADMEVPLAHESAFAGILLAAELLIECNQLRHNPLQPITKLNLLQPLHRFHLEEENKHFSGRCLCHDEIFLNRYSNKWN